MQPNAQDRRMMRRFDMRLPAIVRFDDAEEVRTETQNVSARGVFFYLDRAVGAGTKLEVILTFPPHITLTDAVRVRFTAKVIRVEHPLPSARIGTAAMIEDYQFLRSNGAPDLSLPCKKNGRPRTEGTGSRLPVPGFRLSARAFSFQLMVPASSFGVRVYPAAKRRKSAAHGASRG
jgi:hypothetical protein